MLIIQNEANPAQIRNAIVDLIKPSLVEIRIASAYVTLSGTEIVLDAVYNAVGEDTFLAMPKTLVTSFDFGLTEPKALRHWLNLPNTNVYIAGALRLSQGSLIPLNAFHPKLYAFGLDDQTYNSLVGSANLTSRGFSVNTEAAWAQQNQTREEIDAAFLLARQNTTLLTNELLSEYTITRRKLPPPREIRHEVKRVAQPSPLPPGELPLFRLAIENGDINPAEFSAMWVQGEALQGGSHNQLELPRGGHRFFGYIFEQYEYPDNMLIGQPKIVSGANAWTDRKLTWHGNNKMERMNLPTERQGGYDYRDTAVMFRKIKTGLFELIVTPWDSDLARSWRQASAQRNTVFRLGKINSNRTVGLL